MTTLFDIYQDDKALQALMKGNVKLKGKTNPVVVYARSERPSANYPTEFIEIMQNGSPRSMTYELDMTSGNSVIYMYAKSNSGVQNRTYLDSMLKQVEALVKGKTSVNFIFATTMSNLMSTTSSQITGYDAIAINIKWRYIPISTNIAP